MPISRTPEPKSLPAPRVPGASGLFNMMRNLGGSIGIALLSALLTVRERFHSNRLGEAVSVYNPLTQERLDLLLEDGERHIPSYRSVIPYVQLSR